MSVERNKKIAIADDHVSVREGLARIVEDAGGLEISGMVSDGRALIQLIEKEPTDIVITDIRMPELNGLAAGGIIKERYPHIGLLAYVNEENDYLFLSLLTGGFDGIILKRSERNEAISAIHMILSGHEYFCSYSRERVRLLIQKGLYNPKRKTAKKTFRKREIEVLRLLCKGFKSPDIAEAMQLSIRTIEDYRSSLMKKTNSASIASLAIFALEEGLLEPDE